MERESQEAKGHELTAIRLENFIKNYIPPGWKEPIGKVMTGFLFTAEDIIKMESNHKEGKLKESLNKKYDNPSIVQAILDFFDTQLNR